MSHQKEAVEFAMAEKRPGSILWLKQGTGKTLIGLTIAKQYLKSLVVCPRSLVYNWEKEAKAAYPHLTVGVYLSAMDLKSSSKRLREKRGEVMKSDIVVMGYEACLKMNLSDMKSFECVILDECQRVKTKKTSYAKHLHSMLAKTNSRTVLMSGTPCPNDVSEFWNQFRMIENDHFELKDFPSLTSFRNYFQYLERTQTVYSPKGVFSIPVYGGFKNREEFKKLFGDVIFKKEVNLGLGKLTRQDLRVSAKIPSHVIDALEEAFFEEGRDLENFQTARKFSSTCKAPPAAEYLVDSGEPAVCFSYYPDTLKEIRRLVEKAGKKVVHVTTSDSSRVRMDKIEKFQKGEVDYILGSIGVMSTGYTLTRASLVVMVDLSPVPADNDQAIHRIYRKGQEKACRAVYLSHSSVDSRIIELLASKEKTLSSLEQVVK